MKGAIAVAQNLLILGGPLHHGKANSVVYGDFLQLRWRARFTYLYRQMVDEIGENDL